MVEETSREQLEMILLHRVEILQKIIEDGLGDKTNPRERLVIYKMMVELTDRLLTALTADNRNEDVVKEILSGPQLVP